MKLYNTDEFEKDFSRTQRLAKAGALAGCLFQGVIVCVVIYFIYWLATNPEKIGDWINKIQG